MQVYISVYADGPTRVLRLADEKSTAREAEQSILDLAARIKQVCLRIYLLLKSRSYSPCVFVNQSTV